MRHETVGSLRTRRLKLSFNNYYALPCFTVISLTSQRTYAEPTSFSCCTYFLCYFLNQIYEWHCWSCCVYIPKCKHVKNKSNNWQHSCKKQNTKYNFFFYSRNYESPTFMFSVVIKHYIATNSQFKLIYLQFRCLLVCMRKLVKSCTVLPSLLIMFCNERVF